MKNLSSFLEGLQGRTPFFSCNICTKQKGTSLDVENHTGIEKLFPSSRLHEPSPLVIFVHNNRGESSVQQSTLEPRNSSHIEDCTIILSCNICAEPLKRSPVEVIHIERGVAHHYPFLFPCSSPFFPLPVEAIHIGTTSLSLLK